MGTNTSGLKPFKKGQSGNPGGRPKKRPITDEYFALSEKPLPDKLRKRLERQWAMEIQKGTTYAEANAMRRYLDTLEKGGHPSSREIRESIEGKAPERLEITGAERKEIVIRLIHDRVKR